LPRKERRGLKQETKNNIIIKVKVPSNIGYRAFSVSLTGPILCPMPNRNNVSYFKEKKSQFQEKNPHLNRTTILPILSFIFSFYSLPNSITKANK
jgi:hypothetical protein